MTATAQRSVSRRLAAIRARHGLDDRQQAQLERLLAILAADPSAPTTVRRPERAVDVHIADSLSALDLEAVRRAEVIADIGAGAGLPGLPLAVALPTAAVTLIESASRKGSFIERARCAARIENARVVVGRAEAWREGLDGHDLVTARALAPLAVLCEYAAPLLRVGGALVAWKGHRDAVEEAQAVRSAADLGLEPRDPVRTDPYPGSDSLHLHTYLKVHPTPPRFPRRPGIARKRPLGAST